MLPNSLFYKLMSLLFCVICLSQCTKVADAQLQVNQPVSNPYTMPVDDYLAMANKQEGIAKQSSLMMAAGRLINDGQWQQAEAILSQTSDLSADLAREKNLLLAKVDLQRQQPRTAIAKLAAVQEVNTLPIYQQAQFHEMLAKAYQE
jgi:outer membrane PBP1 activator LpoA protein